MQIGQWVVGPLKAGWNFLRKLPVARYLKPIWKGLLRELIQSAGDHLQVEYAPKIAAGEAKAVEKAIDWWIKFVEKAFEILPLPQQLEKEWLEKCKAESGFLRERLSALCGCSLSAINAAIDESQGVLISWVDKR